MFYLCPKRSFLQEYLHQFGMLFGHGLVVIVNEQAIASLSILQKSFEARHDLLKGLLRNCGVDSNRIKVYFVYALRKKANHPPS